MANQGYSDATEVQGTVEGNYSQEPGQEGETNVEFYGPLKRMLFQYKYTNAISDILMDGVFDMRLDIGEGKGTFDQVKNVALSPRIMAELAASQKVGQDAREFKRDKARVAEDMLFNIVQRFTVLENQEGENVPMVSERDRRGAILSFFERYQNIITYITSHNVYTEGDHLSFNYTKENLNFIRRFLQCFSYEQVENQDAFYLKPPMEKLNYDTKQVHHVLPVDTAAENARIQVADGISNRLAQLP